MQKDPLKGVTEDKNSGNDKKPKESNENESACTTTEYTEAPDAVNDPTHPTPHILPNIISINDVNLVVSDELEIAKIEPVSLFVTFYVKRIA